MLTLTESPATVNPIDLDELAADFPGRIFEYANLLLDVSDPVAKFLAEELSKIGYRARFLQATTPAEYEARESLQETWRDEDLDALYADRLAEDRLTAGFCC